MESQRGAMTFDDAHGLIKKGDILSLRHELDGGASPDLSNRFSWTLLMMAAIERNMPIGELLISRGAALNKTNDFVKPRFRLLPTVATLHSFVYC